jgi:DNA-directed RNA polymerase specialized sigma24 family protein
MPSDVTNLPLGVLCAEARRQEQNWAGGLPSEQAAALELFRRAIVLGDEGAWAALVDLYRPLLQAQANRRAVRDLVAEDDGFCVDRAFQRFWQAARAGRIQALEDLAAILSYLKLCLGSVLLDEARARRRQPTTSIDALSPELAPTDDPSAVALARVARGELWQAIERELRTDDERVVAHLSFVRGLTPREIRARCPRRFADVACVYRIKRNIIDRLRHSRAIRQLVD